MMRRDFVFDEIDSLSDLLCLTLFPKDFEKSEIDKYKFLGDALKLKKELQKLIDMQKLNEAEDLFFDKVEETSLNYDILQVGIWFYLKINKFDDDVLEKADFSRYEISRGLQDIEKLISPQF